MIISVIICTYNRAPLLRTLLQTISEQSLDCLDYEVIVVDNNSTDDTPTIVEELSQHQPNLRYCLEAVQGLSQARNRGWQEAKGDYIAYIDDDCKAPEEWLVTAKLIIQTVRPTVFGGPYFAFYTTPPPPWFKDCYGSNIPGDKAHVCEKNYLTGGNLFIRRDLLTLTSGFDTTFGVNGKNRGYAEEDELLQRIRHHQPDAIIYYDPALYVYHLVRPEKMQIRWQLHNRFVKGRYSYRVYATGSVTAQRDQVRQRIHGHLPHAFNRYLLGLLGFSGRMRARYPAYQQYLYEEVGEDVQRFGWLVEYWRQRLTKK